MKNDDANVGRILSRREALLAAARGGLGLAMANWISGVARAQTRPATRAATQPSFPLVASPSLTEGPFFVDEKLNRSDLVVGTTRPSVVNGLPLLLAFTVYKLSGTTFTPLKGAQVDLWSADAAGAYSDETDPMNHENTAHQTWLRGFQITNNDGIVQFKTILPGWYSGRTPHIHFKIRQAVPGTQSTAEFTSQVFLRDEVLDQFYSRPPYLSNGRDTRNVNDGVYAERLPDGSMAGSHMLLDLEKNADGPGHKASFPLILTDHSMEAARGGRGRGPGRGPGGPGGSGDGPPPRGGRGRPPGPPPDGF